MAPRGFEDEELTISLSSSHIRRPQQQQQQQQSQQQQQHASSDAPTPGSRPADAPLKERIKTEQRIGAYKVLRTLGEGSFGKVKLAIHNGTGQQVALKIIARKKLISRDMAGRVEREIEYLQLLRHPHIIKLYVARPTLAKYIGVVMTDTDLLDSPLSRHPMKSSWSSNMLEANSSTTLFNMAG
jgi:carbon catabolite-derepressing protein kinase